MRQARGIVIASTTALLMIAVVPVAHSAQRLCFGKTPTIKGGAGSNTLRGTPGDDVIHGLAGNDTIYGGGGSDTICGGKGNDLLYGDGPSATGPLSGSDSVSGGPGNDRVHGNDSDDEILAGNDGGDRIYGEAGWDDLAGGPGKDVIDGDAPFGGVPDHGDEVFYDGAVGAVTVNLTTGRATGQGTDTLVSIEDITGSNFGDNLTGTPDQNEIRAGGGNDRVFGKGGDAGRGFGFDNLLGEDDDDYLNTVGGGTGDQAFGGNGTDTCSVDPSDFTEDCESVSNP